MANYNDVIAQMKQADWFRVWESNTHIHFAKRLNDGAFKYKAIRYDKGA